MLLASTINSTTQTPVASLWPLVAPVILGAIAIYLLLPRPRSYPRWLGGLFAALALLSGGALLVHFQAASPETVLFYAFSTIAIVFGGLMITQHNPVHAALSFALVVLSTCGLFLLQAAPFLMAATIIVYAGAIVVTFLFVIMLAQQAGWSDADQRSREPLLACVAGFTLLGTLLYVLEQNYESRPYDTKKLTEQIIDKAQLAASKKTAPEIEVVIGDPEQFLKEFDKPIRDVRELDALRTYLNETVGSRWSEAYLAWNDPKATEASRQSKLQDVKNALAKLEKKAKFAIRDFHGSQQPSQDLPLSNFSGQPCNIPVEDVKRDDQGYPSMPAENTAHLGLSLFTDNLISVELAGVLLLVAAIGAIAITQRRPEDKR